MNYHYLLVKQNTIKLLRSTSWAINIKISFLKTCQITLLIVKNIKWLTENFLL